ncbi:hypothetical protein Hanom_Chr12g01148721 [Helianthus anomalus]
MNQSLLASDAFASGVERQSSALRHTSHHCSSDWNTLYNLSGSHSGQQVAGISKLKSYLNQFGYITNNNSINQPSSNNKFNDYLIYVI